MKVLVTGASGFLGTHLVVALVREGFEVVGWVRSPAAAERLSALGGVPVQGDVADAASLNQNSLLKALEGTDGVFHLAGLVSLHASERPFLERVNVGGTRNVIELCQMLKVRRLVHVSSVVAVGASRSPGGLITEESTNDLRRFNFPNCETKSRSEELVLEATRRGKLDAVVVNPSLIIGAGDARKPPRKGNLLAARGKLAFYPQGGVSAVGVHDVVAAMISAFRKGRVGERYILSGENLLMKDLLAMYSQCAGARAPEKPIPSWILRFMGRLADASRLPFPLGYEGAVASTSYHWFDHSKARRELDFKPGPVLESVRESVEWARENSYI